MGGYIIDTYSLMELTIRSVEDKDRWEEFVLRYSPVSLFQSWDWGSVQEKLGMSLWRIGLYEGAILVGVAQIIKVRAKRGTFLHIRHGPIFAIQCTEYWNAMFSYCVTLAHKENAWFIRVSPLLENSISINILFSSLRLRPSPIHAMDAERSWVLDITASDDELLSGMRKSTRYDIRKAEKTGVAVSFSMHEEDIPRFLELYTRTSGRHDFVPHTGIVEEFAVFVRTGNALLLFGCYNGELLAGALILFYGNQAIYHHGGSTSSHVPVSALVQWSAILEAKKRGKSVYNFWGIAPENTPKHPWNGITLFKKGFGGRQVTYVHAHDLVVHPFYLISYGIEKVRKARKGY